MKKFIAFLRFLQLIFTGLSISMKQCLGYSFRFLNVKRRRWRVSRKKVKRSALFSCSRLSSFGKGVIISFNCEDIDQTLEKVLRKGGKIMMPKTKIEVEGRGWFALFADSEGNRVGLYADK